MSDRYQSFVSSPVGKQLVKTLGLLLGASFLLTVPSLASRCCLFSTCFPSVRLHRGNYVVLSAFCCALFRSI